VSYQRVDSGEAEMDAFLARFLALEAAG